MECLLAQRTICDTNPKSLWHVMQIEVTATSAHFDNPVVCAGVGTTLANARQHAFKQLFKHAHVAPAYRDMLLQCAANQAEAPRRMAAAALQSVLELINNMLGQDAVPVPGLAQLRQEIPHHCFTGLQLLYWMRSYISNTWRQVQPRKKHTCSVDCNTSALGDRLTAHVSLLFTPCSLPPPQTCSPHVVSK